MLRALGRRSSRSVAFCGVLLGRSGVRASGIGCSAEAFRIACRPASARSAAITALKRTVQAVGFVRGQVAVRRLPAVRGWPAEASQAPSALRAPRGWRDLWVGDAAGSRCGQDEPPGPEQPRSGGVPSCDQPTWTGQVSAAAAASGAAPCKVIPRRPLPQVAAPLSCGRCGGLDCGERLVTRHVIADRRDDHPGQVERAADEQVGANAGRRGLRRGGPEAQLGFLGRVLGFAHAAGDPLGARERQRTHLFELLSRVTPALP